jgi:predicted Zn finger-like uncharacterized protein
MKTACTKCGAPIEVDEATLPPAGRITKCGSCGASTLVRPPKPGAGDGFGGETTGDRGGQLGGRLSDPGFGASTSPGASTGGATVRYHVRRRDGKTFGPILESAVIAMLEQGSLTGDDEVSTDAKRWGLLKAVPSFAPYSGLSDSMIRRKSTAVEAARASSSLLTGVGPSSPPGSATEDDEEDDSDLLPAPRGSTVLAAISTVKRTVLGHGGNDSGPDLLAPKSSRGAGGGTRPGGSATAARQAVELPDADEEIALESTNLPAPKRTTAGAGEPRPQSTKAAAKRQDEEPSTDLPTPKRTGAAKGDELAPKGARGATPAAAPDEEHELDDLSDLVQPVEATEDDDRDMTRRFAAHGNLPAPKAEKPSGHDAYAVAPALPEAFELRPANFELQPVSGVTGGGATDMRPTHSMAGGANRGLRPATQDMRPQSAAHNAVAYSHASTHSQAPQGGTLPAGSYGEVDLGTSASLNGSLELDGAFPPPPRVGYGGSLGNDGAAMGVSTDIPLADLGLPPAPSATDALGADVDVDLGEFPPPPSVEQATATKPDDDAPLDTQQATESRRPGPRAARAEAARLKAELSANSGKGRRKRFVVVAGAVFAVTATAVVGRATHWYGLVPGDDEGSGGADAMSSGPLLDEATVAIKHHDYAAIVAAARKLGTVKATGRQDVMVRALRGQLLLVEAADFAPDPGALVREARAVIDAAPVVKDPAANLELRKAQALADWLDGKLAPAREKLQQVITEAPSDATALVYSGWIEQASHNEKEAHELLARAMVADPNSILAKLSMGHLAVAQNDMGTARRMLQELQAQAPMHTGSRILSAELDVRTDPSAAEKTVEPLVERPGPLSPVDRASANRIIAQAALAIGEHDRGETMLRKALEANPSDRQAAGLYANLLAATGRYTEAATRYEANRKNDPTDLETALGLVRVYLDLGRPLDAHSVLGQLTEEQRGLPRVKYWMGRVEEAAGDPVEGPQHAIAFYQQAIQGDPNLIEPYVQLARLHARQSRLEAAFAALRQAEAHSPRSAAVKTAYGATYRSAGQLDRAIEALRGAIAMDPGCHEARVLLGDIFVFQEQFEPAREQYEKVFQAASSFPEIAEKLGKVYTVLGKSSDAGHMFDRALKTDRPAIGLRLAAAGFYLRDGQVERARALVEKVLSEEETTAEAHHLLGLIKMANKRFDDATASFKRALALAAKPEYFYNNGLSLEARGKPQNALAEFDAAIASDPKLFTARLARARVLKLLGRTKEATRELEVITNKDPKNVEAHVLLATCLAELRQNKRAIEELDRAIAIAPQRPDAHFLLGQAYHDMARRDRAISHLKRAIESGGTKSPFALDALYLLGTAYKEAGDRSAARATFERYLEVAPPTVPERREIEKLLAQLGG